MKEAVELYSNKMDTKKSMAFIERKIHRLEAKIKRQQNNAGDGEDNNKDKDKENNEEGLLRVEVGSRSNSPINYNNNAGGHGIHSSLVMNSPSGTPSRIKSISKGRLLSASGHANSSNNISLSSSFNNYIENNPKLPHKQAVKQFNK